MKTRLPSITFFVSALATSIALADAVYIRDVIYVPLRGGQSSEHRILHQGIRSGTKLERLEINEETGFSRVRGSSGLEGWIQSQYLVTEPIARDRLAVMSEEIDRLTEQLDQTGTELSSQSALTGTVQAQLDALQTENTNLSTELSRITQLAAETISINSQNEQLKQDVSDLNDQLDSISSANQELTDSRNQRWYMIGAGTIFLGILLGILFGRQLFGRRDSGWS